MDYTKTNYGNCDFCGAEKVRNPKTGKIFCSQKCWLNKPPDMGGQYPPKRLPPDAGIKYEKDEDTPDWDAIKTREYEKQNHLGARRDAIQVCIANAKVSGLTVTEQDIRDWTEKIKKL